LSGMRDNDAEVRRSMCSGTLVCYAAMCRVLD
jgi:hypothetical protein